MLMKTLIYQTLITSDSTFIYYVNELDSSFTPSLWAVCLDSTLWCQLPFLLPPDRLKALKAIKETSFENLAKRAGWIKGLLWRNDAGLEMKGSDDSW